MQKNFKQGEKRRLQFPVDALSVLNHPVFRTAPNVGGGTDLFGNYPSLTWTAATLQTVYTAWAAANPTTAFPSPTPEEHPPWRHSRTSSSRNKTPAARCRKTTAQRRCRPTSPAPWPTHQPPRSHRQWFQILRNPQQHQLRKRRRRRLEQQHAPQPAAIPAIRNQDLFLTQPGSHSGVIRSNMLQGSKRFRPNQQHQR